MRKIFSYLITGSVLLSQLSACAAPATPSPSAAPSTEVPTEAPAEIATQQPIHLKVGVNSYLSFAPLFIARDEGYFAEQGLDVEIVDFGPSSNEVLPALVAGQLDAAGYTLGVSVFNAISEGNNIKYVADKGFLNPDNCVTDAWVASNALMESGALDTSAGIVGKNFVIFPGGTLEYSLDILLAKNGLTQKDINATTISDSAARVEGLKNGSVDVSILSEPWITRAQTTGAGTVWSPLASILPNQSLGTIVFGPGILEDKPEAGTPFMIAYLKAIAQFNEGKTDRNVEIIANYTKLAPEDIQASCWTSFKDDGLIDQDGMLGFQQWALDKGLVDGLLELDQFWTSQFVDEAAK